MINCKHFKFLHCPQCKNNGFNFLDGYIICSECGLVIKSVESYDNFKTADFKITDKAIPTISVQWNAYVYKKDNMILIDAFHPSRKGGEDSGHDYVTCIINAYKKASKK